MLDITYSISRDEVERLERAAPAHLDEASLRYYFTFGTVNLTCQNSISEALSIQIPVLDFALSLLHISEALEHDSESIFEFTESEAVLIFRRTDNEVVVQTNFSDWSCACTWQDFRELSRVLLEKLLIKLCDAVPEIALNTVIQHTKEKLS